MNCISSVGLIGHPGRLVSYFLQTTVQYADLVQNDPTIDASQAVAACGDQFMADIFGCEPTSNPPAAFDFMKALFTNAWTRVSSRAKTAMPKIKKYEKLAEEANALQRDTKADKEKRAEAARDYVSAIKEKHCLQRPFATNAKLDEIEGEVESIKNMIKSMQGLRKGESH